MFNNKIALSGNSAFVGQYKVRFSPAQTITILESSYPVVSLTIIGNKVDEVNVHRNASQACRFWATVATNRDCLPGQHVKLFQWDGRVYAEF